MVSKNPSLLVLVTAVAVQRKVEMKVVPVELGPVQALPVMMRKVIVLPTFEL